MGWVMRALAGPMLWAALFSAVYALHGAGCNLGWTLRPAPLGNLHLFAMITLWIIGLALHVVLVLVVPHGEGRAGTIVHAGLWIGLVASLVTLFPVVLLSTCG